MTITIRRGDLDADRDAAIAVFARYLNPGYDHARFAWLYTANPTGPGRLWLATDDRTGEIVGTAGAFPREIYLEGREATAWALGDFCVAERYRALGPALALQRACLEDLEATSASLFYDFPHRRLMPIYSRLRLGPARLMRRLARPLRADRRVQQLVGSSVLARGLAAAANAVLARRARAAVVPAAFASRVLEGTCGPAFSALERKVSGDFGTCLRRSAEYLNWRYVNNPVQQHEIITIHEDQRLVAWVVFAEDAGTGTVVDVFGVPDIELIRVAIQAAVAELSVRGCATVVVSLVDSHPWIDLFRGLGFSARETNPVILHPIASAGATTRVPVGPLFLTQGDRDS